MQFIYIEIAILLIQELISLSFYQISSLILSAMTSALLVYFGLHQYAINIRKNNSGILEVTEFHLPDPSYKNKVFPSLYFKNRGTGDVQEIEINSADLILEDSRIVFRSFNWEEKESKEIDIRQGLAGSS